MTPHCRPAGAGLAPPMAARPVGEEPEDDVTVLERRLADPRFD
ncbi:hypothetical protein ACIGW4_02900 [Streptomyces sp. NPDC053513]|uniref:Uncharacterized protein n=1 Tax=Streptomyces litmocidini TaxID=67318 RepID=A0ABW7U080_9ACTN